MELGCQAALTLCLAGNLTQLDIFPISRMMLPLLSMFGCRQLLAVVAWPGCCYPAFSSKSCTHRQRAPSSQGLQQNVLIGKGPGFGLLPVVGRSRPAVFFSQKSFQAISTLIVSFAAGRPLQGVARQKVVVGLLLMSC